MVDHPWVDFGAASAGVDGKIAPPGAGGNAKGMAWNHSVTIDTVTIVPELVKRLCT
jgi:hypothetical protein